MNMTCVLKHAFSFSPRDGLAGGGEREELVEAGKAKYESGDDGWFGFAGSGDVAATAPDVDAASARDAAAGDESSSTVSILLNSFLLIYLFTHPIFFFLLFGVVGSFRKDFRSQVRE